LVLVCESKSIKNYSENLEKFVGSDV